MLDLGQKPFILKVMSGVDARQVDLLITMERKTARESSDTGRFFVVQRRQPIKRSR
jgi:hypothetical protein